MENKNNIGFSLKRLTTEQFAIIDSLYKDSDAIEMKTSVRFGLDSSKKMIAVFFNVSFFQNNAPFLILETASHFHVLDDSWNSFEDIKNSELTIPKNFISHLVMLSIGSTRGVLHAKTENTMFNKFLLPTINVNELIKEDVKFVMDTNDQKSKS
jgi:hypothetical protein